MTSGGEIPQNKKVCTIRHPEGNWIMTRESINQEDKKHSVCVFHWKSPQYRADMNWPTGGYGHSRSHRGRHMPSQSLTCQETKHQERQTLSSLNRKSIFKTTLKHLQKLVISSKYSRMSTAESGGRVYMCSLHGSFNFLCVWMFT